MVDISDFIEPPEPEAEGEAEDFAALKECLQGLADAIASTNLAVLSGTQGDAGGAMSRVQASVAALKRFHDAFKIIKGETEGSGEEDDDE